MSAPLHYDVDALRRQGERDLTDFVAGKMAGAKSQVERDFYLLQASINRCNIDIQVALTEAINAGLPADKIAMGIGTVMGCIKVGVVTNLGHHDKAALSAYLDAEHEAAMRVLDGDHDGAVTKIHPMRGGRA